MLLKDRANTLLEPESPKQSGKYSVDRRSSNFLQSNQNTRGRSKKISKVPNSRQPKAKPERERILKSDFMKLANQWRSETKYMSVMSDIISHSAYQKIISMGKDVVPLILEELRKEPEHWFWALKSITGDNPIKSEDRGRLNKMTEAWLDWGRQHGYKS